MLKEYYEITIYYLPIYTVYGNNLNLYKMSNNYPFPLQVLNKIDSSYFKQATTISDNCIKPNKHT